jgi:hypothetical protein
MIGRKIIRNLLFPVLAIILAGCPSQEAQNPVDTSVRFAGTGDIVITEVMQNPSAVADNVGEWFEVHNISGQTVNLSGIQ